MSGFEKLLRAFDFVFDQVDKNYLTDKESQMYDLASDAIFGAPWEEDNDGQIVIYTGVTSDEP